MGYGMMPGMGMGTGMGMGMDPSMGAPMGPGAQSMRPMPMGPMGICFFYLYELGGPGYPGMDPYTMAYMTGMPYMNPMMMGRPPYGMPPTGPSMGQARPAQGSNQPARTQNQSPFNF